MHRVWQNARNGWEHLAEKTSLCLKEGWTCRDCREPVSPLDDICPTCGTAGPATFPFSAAAVIATFGTVAFLVLLLLT